MNKQREEEMRVLATNLNIEGIDLALLSQALTHPSYAVENGKEQDNQRLEFLGDAVVDLVMAHYLYNTNPKDTEGDLTKRRATLVCEDALSKAAKRKNLGAYLRLGRGERLAGGAKRISNLADAWEALVAVIYLCCGVEPLYALHEEVLGPEIEKVAQGYYGDYKTRLQEYIQQDVDSSLEYRLIHTSGPDHNKVFVTEVLINGQSFGEGKGRTKKASERAAAFRALVKLGVIEDYDDEDIF